MDSGCDLNAMAPERHLTSQDRYGLQKIICDPRSYDITTTMISLTTRCTKSYGLHNTEKWAHSQIGLPGYTKCSKHTGFVDGQGILTSATAQDTDKVTRKTKQKPLLQV